MKLISIIVSAAVTGIATGLKNNGTLKVALVRSAPANWPEPFWNKNWTDVKFDLPATVEKGIRHIDEAAANGAELIAFPELWFPGYPKGIDSVWIKNHAQDYFDNSLVLDSSEWNSLLLAATRNRVFLALAFSHKDNNSIFMGQALITPTGKVEILRHKLRPSGIEREFWSDGTTDGLQVKETAIGRVGISECWEHFHPSMTFNMQAQLENIHIASFPYMPDANDPEALYWESLEVNLAAARLYAVNSGAVTLFTAVGYAAVISGEGLIVAEMKASESMSERPLLYADIDTKAFSNATCNVDGEQSWGVLEQIRGSWPECIPKANGSFVKRVTLTLDQLLSN